MDKKRLLITFCIIAWIIYAAIITSRADPVYTEPVRMRVTCYLPTGNPTASGVMPYEGICAARRCDLGKVAVLYTEDMEYIGTFEVKDTGGAEWLKNGTAIDIYRENMNGVNDWVERFGDFCYVQLIDAEG